MVRKWTTKSRFGFRSLERRPAPQKGAGFFLFEIFSVVHALIEQVKYDNLLKTIFFDAMPALLRLLHCAPVAEYLNVEFPPRHKMVADVVALLKDGKILHLEFQVTNDPDMLWRCFHYYGSISQRWPKAEVIQVVVYLGNDTMTMSSSVERASCRYHFEILNLQEIPAEVFLASPTDAERILAVVSKSEDPRGTIRQILASWKGMPENELRENIERLRTLSQLRKHEIMTVEEVKRLPFEIDVTETELYQLGREDGILKGGAFFLSELLEQRFGLLPEHYRDRLEHATRSQLKHWIGRAADARALADVFDGDLD